MEKNPFAIAMRGVPFACDMESTEWNGQERRKADKRRDMERRASRAVKLEMCNEWQKDDSL